MEKKELIPKERIARIIKSKNPFSDARGRIENYELVFPVNLVASIDSEAGTLRANHYHPEQLQQCLVIKGKYIGVYKDLLYPNAPIRHHLVEAGDLEVMPPMVAHAMIFLEKTVFINLVAGNRDHDKFGKEHTIPYELLPTAKIEEYRSFYAAK